MYRYKRNGFTLVELMAVIIIISLIALLTFPNIINQIKKTKKSNNKMIEDIVIEQTKKYVSDNKGEFDSDTYFVSVKELVDNDYIKEELLKSTDSKIKDKYIIYNNGNYRIVDKLYTELEYIESTGHQAIKTDIYIENTDIIEFVFFDNTITTWENFFGIVDNEFGVVRNVTSSNKIEFEINNKYIKPNISVIDLTKINTWIINIPESTFNWNNKYVFSFESQKGTFTKTVNDFYIFTKLKNGEYETPGSYKLYSFSIKNATTGKYRYDLIPVLDYNGVACLYDKVGKKFYYNEGSEDFLYG